MTSSARPSTWPPASQGQAAGGEVLLTGHTVALAPDIDGVLYEPRGRQPLRNVREPVELLAAIRAQDLTQRVARAAASWPVRYDAAR